MKIVAHGYMGINKVRVGEVIGYDNNNLYVEQDPDKIGRKPVLEVIDYDDKVILSEE